MSVDLIWSFWGLGAVVLSAGTIVYWESTCRLPASIPWVGLRNEVFSKPRAWIREYTAGFNTLEDGYSTHNSKGKSFALLDTSGRSQVMVPKERVRWLVGQPDDVLSQRKVIDIKFGAKYLGPSIRRKLSDEVTVAVRRDLTRSLGRCQGLIFNALRERIDSIMGLDEASWNQVNLVDVLHPAISNATNLMFFGEELGRNEAFLEPMGFQSKLLGFLGVLLGQYVPFIIAPAIGPVVQFCICWYRKRFLKYLTPMIQERMDRLERMKTTPDPSYEVPRDLIQYTLMITTDSTAVEVADAILSLALATDHATANVTLSAFLDLLSAPPELGYFDVIRNEAAAAFRREEDWSDLASLHKLTHTDSALRESLRHNPLFGRGLMQEVIHKNGITLPDGQHVPRGAWLGAYLAGIGMDERYYLDPHKYDPFRFSRARAELASKGEDPDSVSSKAVGDKPNGAYLSMSDETFATFGLGKHACPGRWFAAHIMKLTLAYVSLNYDIQPIVDRPPNQIVGDCIVAAQSLKLNIRRRKAAL